MTTTANTVGDAGRLIGRLPVDRRRTILEALAASSRDRTVLVEHSYNRTLEDATNTVGTLIGVAYNSGGGSTDVLVVEPSNPELRLIAIPAAHVCRISAATAIIIPAQGISPVRHGFRRGEVLAGPAYTRQEA